MRLGLGTPEPLGVTPVPGGVNVAVFSAHATAIEFCLADGATHRLTGRTGDVFHGFIPGIGIGARYALRAHGPFGGGHKFNPAKLLIDPYALALDDGMAVVMDRAALAKPLTPHRIPWAETVLYELHVRGFTKRHPGIPASLRGTFAALAEPAAIAHLRGLGITTVELMPAAAWVDERHLPPLGLHNYWGYNPIALMAPDPRLAPGGWPEIRRATDALHAAGLEVILDVVLNHTGESDELGPTLSLRGLDNATYYRLLPEDPTRYINDMGCGNCLALHRLAVVRLAMDALRTWVELGGIDGFRFDLATAMGRTDTGFDPAAPLLAAIAQDPVLRAAKLIAEPWDIGPGGYQAGAFPAAYGEWNDRFRDDVRRFWRGDTGMRGALATRLAGSADLFAAKRVASRSANFITAHDGFTLADLVSYAAKHNEANGEQNRDGGNENFSWNHGAEGPTDDPAIRDLRQRDERNLLATLLLARGTPMLSMGAELGTTQAGNNNAYAQDNETTWLNWEAADQGLLDFTRQLTALRRAHPALRGESFLTGAADPETGLPDVQWRGAGGEIDWHNGEAVLVAVFAQGEDRVALALNPGGAVALELPQARAGFVWKRVLDTADAHENLAARSVALFAETEIQTAAQRPADAHLLARLAEAAGIAPEWWDITGNRHAVSPETQRAILRAMGLDAATHAQASDSLAALTAPRALPLTHMVYAGEPGSVPGARGRLILRGEVGEIRTDALPPLEAGHYTVWLEGAPETICHLTAAPRACYMPPALSQPRFGISVQSYALRRAGDGGIGDFAALAAFAAEAGRAGASVVGVQPLHMLFPGSRGRASPYHPSDRRYLDPLHLALPGLGDRAGDWIDYPAIWTAKSAALEALFTAMPDAAGFAAFIAAGGEALAQFAAFQVISQLYPGTPWQSWPVPLRDAGSEAVRQISHSHARAHHLAMFQQYLCDQQLSAAAQTARANGVALGLYRDLAVGCAPDGAEAWASGGVFAQGVSIGAPPDPLGPEGQVWNLPPPNPLAWRASNYASFRAAISANMRHAGALRIDHVMGLARLFWVPDGASAMDGAYVRYPVHELIGQLALESHRARCLVVGEDLGTVPEGLRGTLAAANMLSYRVMLLERQGTGFTPPKNYPAQALACAATHDLAPLAGWWRGQDIAERHALGLAGAEEYTTRAAEKQALAEAAGFEGEDDLSDAALAAIHVWLAQAPSSLLMVQAEDLAGETISQNLPGTDRERPNWRHRLGPEVTALLSSARAQLCLEAIAAHRPGA